MTQEAAIEIMNEYEGQEIEKIGTHLPKKSTYNHNYYRMPNDTEVLVICDDNGYYEVYVVASAPFEPFHINRYVGYYQEGDTFHVDTLN